MLKSPRPAPRGAQFQRRTFAAIALAALLLLQPFAPTAFAVNISSFSTPVTQNFDGMTPNAATATLPADFRADQNQGVRVVGSYSSAGTATTQTGGPGLSTTAAGGTYNFGSGTTNTGTDRAVGFLGSGSINGGNLYAKLTNTTGRALTGLRISYDVEKYRTGSNAAGFRFQLFYSTTGAAGSWTSAGTDFLTSFPADAATLAGCNPAPCSTTPVTGQLLSLPAAIANNSDLYLAWNYGVTTGTTSTNAQALGIDNISITPVGTFGDGSTADGITTTDVSDVEFGTSTDNAGFAVAVQTDGRIVVGGYAVDPVNGDREFAVARYTTTGDLDTTFGGNGIVTLDFDGGNDRIWAVTLQTDGKIVAAGQAHSLTTNTSDVALARFNTNGTPDATFGTNGVVTTDHLIANNIAYAVAMSGTNIVIAGTTASVSGDNDFLVARYTTAGLLDPTFNTLGTPGINTLGFNGFDDVARGVAVQTDGKIVAAGHAYNGSNEDIALARFNSNGTVDTAFGVNGKITTDVFGSSLDQAYALALDSTQRIVVAGYAFNNGTGNRDFVLARYLSTGALDTTFNPGAEFGIVTTDFGKRTDIANAVAIQTDGKIVVGGYSNFNSTSDDFAVARYNANGTLDTTFDVDGRQVTVIGNAEDRIYGLAVQTDGKIVAAGFSAIAGASPIKRNFALVRYNSNGSIDADANSAPPAKADLLLTMTDSEHTVVQGSDFSYIITVTNKGPAAATNVTVEDALPAEVTLVSATPSKGNCNNANPVQCNLGTLALNETATVTIEVTAETAKLISNTATVTSAAEELNPANNTATELTRIIRVSGITLNPTTVVGGCENSTGTVTLSGNAPAGGIHVALSSGNPAASVPASAFVPAGALVSEPFTVTTSSVNATTTGPINASLGTSSVSRRLTVTSGSCGR